MLSRREKSLSKATSIVPKSNTALFKFVSIVLFFVSGIDEIGGCGLYFMYRKVCVNVQASALDALSTTISWFVSHE